MTSIFTVRGSVNAIRHVPPSGGGQSNMASLFDYLPPSYDEVILDHNNNSTVNALPLSCILLSSTHCTCVGKRKVCIQNHGFITNVVSIAQLIQEYVRRNISL